MAEAYAWADIVICRSGAMTISELIATNTLAILVPFPYAVDNHQTMNAQYLSNNGAGILIEESIFNAELIDKEILALNSEKLQEMTKNLELLSVANPEMIIADYLFG
jgi:UDP-N-acetylglucosamine--N-acetylmuramyl-(pentapeptide) pyrophosphoryl-undecaprenol N-acetylglucosamine transferase